MERNIAKIYVSNEFKQREGIMVGFNLENLIFVVVDIVPV
jgi:hypothetical protein